MAAPDLALVLDLIERARAIRADASEVERHFEAAQSELAALTDRLDALLDVVEGLPC